MVYHGTMTINRTPALAIFAPDNYVRAERDETYALAQAPRVTVSLARIASREHQPYGRMVAFQLREYATRHTMLASPIIRGLRLADTPDESGNDLFADVQYAAEGFCATYGGHMVGNRVVWQCYMD